MSFQKMAQPTRMWQQLTTSEANALILGHVSDLCDISALEGEIPEEEFDKRDIPHDASGVRRGELKALSRHRAGALNKGTACKKRREQEQQAALDKK